MKMEKPYPQWNEAEQNRLWQRTAQGDRQARNRIIEGNLPLVRMVAGRFYAFSDRREDLVQAGVLGLMQAVKGFDPARNVPFSSYAVPFILGEMRRFARESLGNSRGDAGLYHRIRQAREEYIERNFAEPTVKELEEILDIPADTLAAALNAGDEVLTEAADSRAENAFTAVEDRELLQNLLIHLDPRERDLLEKRFFGAMQQREIALRYRISQAQVSRLEKAALMKIRRLLKEAARENSEHS